MPDPLTHSIYLDHAAATPLDPRVYEAMLPYLADIFGNPSSIHHVGRAASDALRAARATLANALAVDPHEIILTGSGTESDNLAIIGLARAQRQAGHGNHLIISAIEHKAVMTAADRLREEGFSVTILPVDHDGLLELTTLEEALTEDTMLVSIMYANNEIGTIQPIREIATLLAAHSVNKRPPLFHTDACQAAGQLPVAPRTLGVDAMTINSAKLYGPKGIGLLYLRKGLAIQPLISGGQQEDGRRAGTENVALAIGFAKALELAVRTTDSEAGRLAALRDHFLSELRTRLPSLLLNGHPTKRLPNNVHICLPDVEGEALLLRLDHAGICAATGSACNATDLSPSHVLTAIGRGDELIHGSLRFTLGRDTTAADLTKTAEVLTKVVSELRAISALPLNTTTHVRST